ncbi:MAG: SH3 domain-containing protein [Lachnospiraceae bacterium]|nr:SH3 domain-containing protein [Lachnospiraceae bacterium]
MIRKRVLTCLAFLAVILTIIIFTIPAKADGAVFTAAYNESAAEALESGEKTLTVPAAGVAMALGEGADYESLKEQVQIALDEKAGLKETDVKFENLVVKVTPEEEEEIIEEAADEVELPVEEEVPDPDCVCDVEYTFVRESNSTASTALGKMFRGAVGTVLSEEGDWYLVQSGSITGYVLKRHLLTGEEAAEGIANAYTTKATVLEDNVALRLGPDKNSESIGILPKDEELEVIATTDQWAEVLLHDTQLTEDLTGFVFLPCVSLETTCKTALTDEEISEQERIDLRREMEDRIRLSVVYQAANGKPSHFVPMTGGSAKGRELCEFAMQFIGNPYVSGGTSLTEGCDCSGFVMAVYAEYGFTLTHSTEIDQREGVAVESIETAEPGDIICYQGHVGIYIGDGMIVHAAGEAKGICLCQACYTDIVTIRRLLTE